MPYEIYPVKVYMAYFSPSEAYYAAQRAQDGQMDTAAHQQQQQQEQQHASDQQHAAR